MREKGGIKELAGRGLVTRVCSCLASMVLEPAVSLHPSLMGDQ